MYMGSQVLILSAQEAILLDRAFRLFGAEGYMKIAREGGPEVSQAVYDLQTTARLLAEQEGVSPC